MLRKKISRVKKKSQYINKLKRNNFINFIKIKQRDNNTDLRIRSLLKITCFVYDKKKDIAFYCTNFKVKKKYYKINLNKISVNFVLTKNQNKDKFSTKVLKRQE